MQVVSYPAASLPSVPRGFYLSEPLIPGDGQEGETPQLYDIAFCITELCQPLRPRRGAGQTLYPNQHNVNETQQRLEHTSRTKRAQRRNLKPIIIGPTPHFPGQVFAIRLDQIPQVVIRSAHIAIHRLIAAVLRHITSGLTAAELPRETRGHHRQLPRPDYRAVVVNGCPVSGVDRVIAVGRVGDQHAN